MKQVSLSDLQGLTIEDPDGSHITIHRVDPLNEVCGWDGYNAKWKDPCAGSISFEQLKAKGYKVVLTDEEWANVDRLRLTRQVEKKAKALGDALHNWLVNEKAR